MHTGSVIATLLALACLVGSASAAHVVWVEAERFGDRGGWTLDGQFIDQMGSPYLMAIGLGEPVEDAATTVAVPRPGRYRLWARTRDWVPAHHPGRFRIVLGGRPVEHDLRDRLPGGSRGRHRLEHLVCGDAGQVVGLEQRHRQRRKVG